MKRRGFLKFLGGAAVVPVVAPVLSKFPQQLLEEESISGFGLAQIKVEGSKVVFDSSFSKSLWPGLAKWYEHEYQTLGDSLDGKQNLSARQDQEGS